MRDSLAILGMDSLGVAIELGWRLVQADAHYSEGLTGLLKPKTRQGRSAHGRGVQSHPAVTKQ
jgi:hypothetical protein